MPSQPDLPNKAVFTFVNRLEWDVALRVEPWAIEVVIKPNATFEVRMAEVEAGLPQVELTPEAVVLWASEVEIFCDGRQVFPPRWMA